MFKLIKNKQNNKQSLQILGESGSNFFERTPAVNHALSFAFSSLVLLFVKEG